MHCNFGLRRYTKKAAPLFSRSPPILARAEAASKSVYLIEMTRLPQTAHSSLLH